MLTYATPFREVTRRRGLIFEEVESERGLETSEITQTTQRGFSSGPIMTESGWLILARPSLSPTTRFVFSPEHFICAELVYCQLQARAKAQMPDVCLSIVQTHSRTRSHKKQKSQRGLLAFVQCSHPGFVSA